MRATRVGFLMSILMVVVATVAAAQTYPYKPIRVIVPYTPGGTTDLLARVVGKSLSARWGQPVVVENRPGASGMIGTDMLARAAPDGYTIGLAVFGTHAANVSLYPKITYDAIKDFTPISLAVSAPMLLVVSPLLNVKSLNGLIALAKSKPGSLAYASGGNGSSPHIGMELFNNIAGISMIHVPYKGTAGAYADMLAGRVSLIFDVLPTSLPHVKSGELVPLAVGSSTRLPQLPNVPTIAESGIADFEFNGWMGFAGPANLPKDILSELSLAITGALKSREANAALSNAGLVVIASTPEEFAIHIRSEIKKLAKLIKATNIKGE